MVDVAANLRVIMEKIAVASQKAGRTSTDLPKLVAVSKLKPPEMVIAAYEAGCRVFGENYVDELIDKCKDRDLQDKCKDIQWHFIGHLQRNKVKKLVRVPNLHMIETIDSKKLASEVQKAWANLVKSRVEKLNVMVQVNTSREAEKSGCSIEETVDLVKHVIDNCQNLVFSGLMTIGAYGYDMANGPNPDFLALKDCQASVAKALDLPQNDVKLSMGMSTDYEHAIELGSSYIRVGTAIFGERAKKV